MKINDKILIPSGIGVIKKIEEYPWLGKGYKKRYCVEIEKNSRLICYFEKDVKKIKVIILDQLVIKEEIYDENN